ncbi:MAG: hypothetical protein M3299_01380 [Thermoproteota archaeon]|nr:hypothetical protein [Thermoproteota archaeon]
MATLTKYSDNTEEEGEEEKRTRPTSFCVLELNYLTASLSVVFALSDILAFALLAG